MYDVQLQQQQQSLACDIKSKTTGRSRVTLDGHKMEPLLSECPPLIRCVSLGMPTYLLDITFIMIS